MPESEKWIISLNIILPQGHLTHGKLMGPRFVNFYTKVSVNYLIFIKGY